MKKSISLILSLVMIASVLFGLNITVYANADVPNKIGDNITVSYDGQTLTLSGKGRIEDQSVSPFIYCFENIFNKKIVISSGITYIGKNLFDNAEAFNEVEIADTVTEIGSYAFNSTRIAEFNIPASVIAIGDNAFAPSSNSVSTKMWNEAINVDAENKYFTSLDGVLYNKNMTKLIQAPAAFSGNDGEFSIPDTVVQIGKNAFMRCLKLKKVTIPKSVNSIGDYAFSLCKNLEEVIFLNGRADISSSAFRYMKMQGQQATYPLNNDFMLFKVFQNSSALVYAKNNEIQYELIDPDTPTLDGWQDIGGKRYYYENGEPLKGLQELDGNKYIFSISTGELLYGKVRCAGKYYIMNKSTGAMLYGKVSCDGKYYIMSKSTGEMLYGMVRCNGKYYIMSKSTGEMLYGKVSCNGKGYIMSKATGEMLYGKVTCNAKTYICSKSDGHIFTNQYVSCDGVRYYCDAQGVARK